MTSLRPIYAGLAGSRDHTQVEIQDVQEVGGMYKVVAAITGIHNENELSAAVAKITDGAARVVRGSSNIRGRLVVAMLASNARSKPLDGSMTMVTASTASDASGNIWSVVNDGSGKRVVLESADDLEAILQDRMQHRRIVANPVEGRGLATAGWDNGDVVRYVDTDRGQVHCAMAFATDEGIVALATDGTRKRIVQAAIIESVEAHRVSPHLDKLQRECAGTQLTPAELEQSIAYLTKAGILSDEMAQKMRALSNTPFAGNA